MTKAAAVALLVSISSCASGPSALETTTDPRLLARKGGRVSIVFFGRSVTEGWFAHWGAQNRQHTHGRFTLLHQPFQPYDPEPLLWPEQIDKVLTAGGKRLSAVQYKLCFVDFSGDTRLFRFYDLAEAIYDVVVKKHGKLLIIGNALPSVAAEGSRPTGSIEDVVKLNAEYNVWLERFAKRHPRVVIFDQNSVLRDENGRLKAEFALSPTDSHLKPVAYRALDAAYFAMLDKQFGAGSSPAGHSPQ